MRRGRTLVAAVLAMIAGPAAAQPTTSGATAPARVIAQPPAQPAATPPPQARTAPAARTAAPPRRSAARRPPPQPPAAPPAAARGEPAPVPDRDLEAPRSRDANRPVPRLDPVLIDPNEPRIGSITDRNNPQSREDRLLRQPAPGARLSLPFTY